MNLNLKKPYLILVLIFYSFTFSVLANTRSYLLQDIIKSSNFIGEINITSKSKISKNNKFSCGYEYTFSTIKSQKDNTEKNIFWSMSESFNINNNYQIFLIDSDDIFDSRIKEYKVNVDNEVNENMILSFQQCKQNAPKLGVLASFNIRTNKQKSFYININKSLFLNKELYKKCSSGSDGFINKIKLRCFQHHIENVLAEEQQQLQKIYDGIIKGK